MWGCVYCIARAKCELSCILNKCNFDAMGGERRKFMPGCGSRVGLGKNW